MSHEPGCGQVDLPAEMCSVCLILRRAYQRGRQDATAGNLVYLDYVLREVVDKLLADCKHDFQLLDTRDDVR